MNTLVLVKMKMYRFFSLVFLSFLQKHPKWASLLIDKKGEPAWPLQFGAGLWFFTVSFLFLLALGLSRKTSFEVFYLSNTVVMLSFFCLSLTIQLTAFLVRFIQQSTPVKELTCEEGIDKRWLLETWVRKTPCLAHQTALHVFPKFRFQAHFITHQIQENFLNQMGRNIIKKCLTKPFLNKEEEVLFPYS